MEHKYLIYLVLSSMMLFCTSCGSQGEKEFKNVEKYFNEKHNYQLQSGINKVVVISEGSSGCPNCEKSFANTAYHYLSDSAVFLVTARGTQVNVEQFLKSDKNCFFDWELDTDEFPELKSARVVYLKNSAVDTAIVINSVDLREQLEFFMDGDSVVFSY